MWSYDPTNLSETTNEGRKNIVRLLVGDTDQLDPQLSDEEIEFALSSNTNKIYSAAVLVVSSILSKYARLVNVELDEAIREDYSDLVDNYTRLRKELAAKGRFSGGGIRISATGLTHTQFEAADADPNRVRPGIEQNKWGSYQYGLSYDGYRSVTT